MNQLYLPPACLHAGDLILVSAQAPYREKRNPQLLGVPGPTSPVRLEAQAAGALNKLMDALRGWDAITPVSGWRSRQEQQDLWDQSLAENGEAFTRTFVAKPGCSEHETGLAIDLGLRGEVPDPICPAFPREGICQAVQDLAPAYGFVLRYPAGKESVTGIGYEPWHFRYVGPPHAALMTERGWALEEYHQALRAGPLRTTWEGVETWISFQPANPGGVTLAELPQGMVCAVSGNNTDGFILTTRRAEDVRKNLGRP